MKGRSHRLPISEPLDDWGDGSWTVDCVCGVNFDDGEEMVNCDECGIWVHTRCSRFVKGETSFACDKCKNKKSRNDSEETEVAQLLVELPTKTIRMENPLPSSAPPRSSFRLWTDIPIEERVHVQGIPGGEPTLFQGLSSVFSPELWKCTGYVPKKFNFQYKEFPCWDEKLEVVPKVEEENENLVDKGAGVLFSLSKEIVSATPLETFIGLRGSFEEVGCERKPYPKEMKKREGKDPTIGRVQHGIKRERTQLRPVAVHSGKRKKEEFGASKDRSGKKARSADKEPDNKKSASVPAIDARKLEFHEDGRLQVIKTDSLDTGNEDKREIVLPVPDFDVHLEATNNLNQTLNTLATKDNSAEGVSDDISRDTFAIEMVVNVEKEVHETPTRNESSSKTAAIALSLIESVDAGNLSRKEEDVYTAVDGMDHLNDENHVPRDLNEGSSSVAVDSQKSKPPPGDLPSAAPEVQGDQMLQDSNGHSSSISVQSNIKVRMEADDEHPKRDLDSLPSPFSDVKNDVTKFLDLQKSASALVSESHQVHDAAEGNLQSSDHKTPDIEREFETAFHCNMEKFGEGIIPLSDEPCQFKQEFEGSVGPVTVQEGSSEPNHVSKHAKEPSKIGETNQSPPAHPSQHKLVEGVVKSSILSNKSSGSGGCKPLGALAPPKPIHSTKQRVRVTSYTDNKKDHTVSDTVRDDSRHEVPRKTVKEHSKASVNSTLKTTQSSRISHASASNCTQSDSKEQLLHPSSKASSTLNVAVSSVSVESASSLPTLGASHVQSKTTASVFSPKGEKLNPFSSQSSSKLNHSPSMQPPAPVNSTAVLSDEELALLLHQELNSSPRVPRVPRARHAGSMTQLALPTAASMLIKRQSRSGGKDQIMVSRRKNKDALKDGSRNFREPSDETKKIDRVPSSPDQRRQDPVFTMDGSRRREASGRSPEVVHSAKKNMPPASTTIVNSSPSTEVIDHNTSFTCNSSNSIADDTGTISGPASHTLPGLIDQIMSKGKRMTYEELCNAVLPHWHNLRKHNGERYAYSSHSQAVLDCLRNRNEWAQLVDRGPKTNASRKRRKLDADPSLAESEDNGYDKGSASKELESKSVESHQEDFPKGKRKARKRRRLALQGRGIKDVRKRRKVDAITEEDHGPFSHSSEGTEGVFSEDEIQGARTCPIGSEASSSSDEAGPL